jgi:hypothetical protein
MQKKCAAMILVDVESAGFASPPGSGPAIGFTCPISALASLLVALQFHADSARGTLKHAGNISS